jgi:hypothetical protein
MNRARALVLSAAVYVACTGARFQAHPAAEAAVVRLEPATVLARYADALANLKRPPTQSFEYSVEQLGLRNIEQTHRVYRSGLNERDETLIVDGYTLKQPAVRILANRTNRYDIAAVAPKPADYTFTFDGTKRDAAGYTYVFRTAPRATPQFAVSEIEIDGRSFLPSLVRFKIGGGGARGSGELAYGLADAYWVVRAANVSVHLTNGATAHERIEWSAYRFPPSLPASTFEAPRPIASPPAPVVEGGP